jgi:hypothetical protein
MTTIISLILLLLLVLFTITNIKEERFINVRKYIILLYVISIIVFVILFLVDNDIMTKDKIINSLTISLMLIPFTLQNINNLKIDENISRIKTIITNKINDHQLRKFKQSHIKVVLISKENKLGLKETKIEEISAKTLKKTTFINSNDIDVLDEYINKTTLKKTSNLNKIYDEIIENRLKEDNYLKSIKFILLVYVPLLLSTILFKVYSITSPITLLLVVMIKYLSIITTRFIINKNRDDHDIKYNKPKPLKKYLTVQEKFLIVLQTLVSYAFLITPYLYLLLIGGPEKTINTIYLVIYFYIMIFSLVTTITDKPIIKNILNKKVLIMTILIIIITILINYINVFENEPITIRNYIPCIIIAFVSTLFFEYTKLARYLTMKRRQKNESKNHK